MTFKTGGLILALWLFGCGGREQPPAAPRPVEGPQPRPKIAAPAGESDGNLDTAPEPDADTASTTTRVSAASAEPAYVAEPAMPDTDDEVVRAPVSDPNPFDNPEMFAGNSGNAEPTAVPNDPNRPMKISLDFHSPGDVPPFPAPNPRQYKQWRQKGRIPVGFSHLDQVCFSPDAALILAMSENEGTVRIYDAETLKLINNYSILGTTSFSSFDVLFWPVIEKEPLLLFAKGNGLMLYRALQGEPLSYLRPDPTSEIRWSDDRQTLVAYGHTKDKKGYTVSFYRRKSPPGLELIASVQLETGVRELDISRDNRFLAVAATPNIELYSLETGEKIWSTPAPRYVWSVDISPDGTLVAFGGEHLVIADIQNPNRRTEYFKFNNNINRVRFSPSGDAVFVSSYDGHIRIVAADLSSPKGKLIGTLRHGGTANVYEMDFAADGNRMVSVSGDKTVRVWGGKP